MEGRLSDTLALLECFGFRKTKTNTKVASRGSLCPQGLWQRLLLEDIRKCIRLAISRRGDHEPQRTVFECSGYSVAIHASHRSPEQAAATYELMVGVAETRCKLKDDEENVIHDIGPFAAVPIGKETEENGTNRAKHERRGDAPANIIRRLFELSSQRR